MEDEAEFGKERVSSKRHPTAMLALFFVIIGVQIVIALMGYRYIGLVTEYSSRNLVHLDAVAEAQNEIEVAQIGVDFPIQRLQTLVGVAREQAAWCLRRLSPLEQRFLELIGAKAALDICADEIARGDFALELLDKLSQEPKANAPLVERPFALVAQLEQSLRLMLDNSREFAPYVISIRSDVSKVVHLGTTLAGFFMLLLAMILSRTILGNWRAISLQSKEILKQSNRFKLAMQSNVDGLALFDGTRRLLNFNEKFVSLLGIEEQSKQSGALVDLLEDALIRKSIVGFDGCGDALLAQLSEEAQQKTGDGLQVELSGDRHAILTLSETGFGDILLLVKDITVHVRSDREQEAHDRKLRQIYAQIEESSKRDPLTSLANRRGLDEEMQRWRDGDLMTVIRIDLDRFKQVNDVFGHDAGDHVLVHVSSLLRELCRKEDTPVRVGGDEFLVICAPGTAEDDAVKMSNRLLERVKEPVMYQGKQLLFGASFGVASARHNECADFSLLQSADAALYVAKSSGRSTVKRFTHDMRDAVRRERRLAETFLPGLKSGELKVYAQSIHSAEDWSLVGVEVLARWQHPEFGLLAPDAFFPVVKQLGMEAEMDEAIFMTALDQMREIEQSAFRFPRVSFNVTAARLLDPEFQATVQGAGMYWDKRLAFEILETISLDEGNPVLRRIQQLKKQGIEFDVDDFGSDHASINSITEIGPSTVKIDRKITAPVGKEDSAETMFKAIVEMGKAMNVTITAEGIETEEQAQIVRRLGVDRLQGYFFSKPMPIVDLVDHASGFPLRPIESGVKELPGNAHHSRLKVS